LGGPLTVRPNAIDFEKTFRFQNGKFPKTNRPFGMHRLDRMRQLQVNTEAIADAQILCCRFIEYAETQVPLSKKRWVHAANLASWTRFAFGRMVGE
jgi:hypothetical protein